MYHPVILAAPGKEDSSVIVETLTALVAVAVPVIDWKSCV